MATRTEMVPSVSGRLLPRHAVATLAYRGAKSLRGEPEGFAEFRRSGQAGKKTRTPGAILAHLSDLLDWGLARE